MIRFNHDMEAAPRDRRILVLRPDGDIGIAKWDLNQYHNKPSPYWADERQRWLGVKWCRENPPIAWTELVPDNE